MVNPIFSFLDQLLGRCASVDDPALCRQRVTDSERTEKRVNCGRQQLLQLSSAYAMHYARVLQCTMQERVLSFLSFPHAVFCRGTGIHRMSAFFDGLLHPGEASEWLISSVWPRRWVPPVQRQVPRVGLFFCIASIVFCIRPRTCRAASQEPLFEPQACLDVSRYGMASLSLVDLFWARASACALVCAACAC